jgi:three-Cys-motif partner protein
MHPVPSPFLDCVPDADFTKRISPALAGFKFGAITTGFFKRDATEIAGSAQRALSIDPPFDALHFIEKRSACLKALRKMTAGDRRVTIHDGDANAAIRKLCGEIDWGRTRGVIFLDPFGASLEWQTLKVIAATKALDVWYLFPLSSVFRNAPLAFEKLTPEKRASITKILGTSEWEAEFYRELKVGTGFFDIEERKVKRAVNVDAIEAFIDLRLKTVFPAVAKPRRQALRDKAAKAIRAIEKRTQAAADKALTAPLFDNTPPTA